jgi:ferredoxin-NADP reductase
MSKSMPDSSRIELTVERLDEGEVSPYLTDELRPGDQIELRGPVGGYFVWEPPQGLFSLLGVARVWCR